MKHVSQRWGNPYQAKNVWNYNIFKTTKMKVPSFISQKKNRKKIVDNEHWTCYVPVKQLPQFHIGRSKVVIALSSQSKRNDVISR